MQSCLKGLKGSKICLLYFRTLHNERFELRGSLCISPTECLYSVAPEIRVEGLQPSQPITLKAQVVDDDGKIVS